MTKAQARHIAELKEFARRAPDAASKTAGLNRLYEAAVTRGLVPEGLEALARLAEISPDDSKALIYVARAFQHHGDLDSALSYCDRALSADPASVMAGNIRSQLLARVGRRGEALLSIRDALREQPASPAQAAFLGDILLEIGAFKSARLLLEKTLSLSGVRPLPAYLRLARLALWATDGKTAEGWAAKALALAPALPEALGLRGAAKVLSGKIAEALADLDAALASPLENLEALLWRAEARRRLGRFLEALSDVENVLSVSGDALAARAEYALILMRIPERRTHGGKLAAPAVKDALDLFPAGFRTPAWDDVPGLCAALETILRRLGGNRSSQTTTLGPDGELTLRESPPSVRQLCRSTQQSIYYTRTEQVLARFAELERLHPAEPVVYTHRGEVLLWLGRYEDASRDFEKAVALEPQTRWAYIGLFAGAALQGRYAEAFEWDRRQTLLKEYAVIGPGRTFHCYAGEALRALGRHEEAERSLERSLELDPKRLGAWINMTLVQLARGREQRARRCFDVVRELGRPLVADAAAELDVDVASLAGDGPAQARAVLERCLLMLRGNRSSSILTYFDESGELVCGVRNTGVTLKEILHGQPQPGKPPPIGAGEFGAWLREGADDRG